MGLFAIRDFEQGECIDLYEGPRLSIMDVSNRPHRAYELQVIEHFCVINGASTQSCISRYINNAPEEIANCRFTRFCPSDSVFLVSVQASRGVVAGEEFLVNYGA